jgi:hypothetical protein
VKQRLSNIIEINAELARAREDGRYVARSSNGFTDQTLAGHIVRIMLEKNRTTFDELFAEVKKSKLKTKTRAKESAFRFTVHKGVYALVAEKLLSSKKQYVAQN